MRSALAVSAALMTMAACASLHGAPPTCACPTLAAEWDSLRSTTTALADSGLFAAADSVIVAFAEEHEGTHHARESSFWRALYWLDPRNPEDHRADAVSALDAYLLSDSVSWYRSEARVLRQLTATEPLPPPVAEVVGQVRPASPDARDLEIQRLRARNIQLEEELERIRRRLSTPPP